LARKAITRLTTDYATAYSVLPFSRFQSEQSDCCKFVVVFFEELIYNNGGGVFMPNIKPISDLRNYGEVLRDVAVGAPVFLTKNGHGRYAVLDIEEYKEYEKMQAWRRLKAELDEGRRSGEEEGWISADEMRKHLEERYRG
jgi:prevent-host-death family protein